MEDWICSECENPNGCGIEICQCGQRRPMKRRPHTFLNSRNTKKICLQPDVTTRSGVHPLITKESSAIRRLEKENKLLKGKISYLSPILFDVPFYNLGQCIHCGQPINGDDIMIGREGAFALWQSNSVVCNPLYRMCQKCYLSSDFTQIIIPKVKESHGRMSCIKKLMESVRTLPIFHFNCMNDNDCKTLSGLESKWIKELSGEVKLSEHLLFQFYVICRQNIRQRPSAALNNCVQSTISIQFTEVLNSLYDIIVPQKLCCSFEEVKNHIPQFFSFLFPGVSALWDGTYWYCEKSKNFDVQYRSYSPQKSSNLFKSMGISLPDGYWWDIIGLFYSDSFHNDEMIFEYIEKHNMSEVKTVFPLGSGIILDRGFLRVKSKHFIMYTPGKITRGKQLSCFEANRGRFTTRVRNVNEGAFGRFSHWKITSDKIDLGYVPKFNKIIRVLAATENKYFPPLRDKSEYDENDKKVFQLRKLDQNPLFITISSLIKTNWKNISENQLREKIPDSLTLENIRKWNAGPYSLKLAPAYLKHLQSLSFSVNNGVIRCKGTKSRFTRKLKTSKGHVTYILFGEEETFPMNEIFIYCSCPCGMRTIGSCAHGILCLYYLSFLKSGEKIPVSVPLSTSRVSEIINIEEFTRETKTTKKKHNYNYINNGEEVEFEFNKETIVGRANLMFEGEETVYEISFDRFDVDPIFIYFFVDDWEWDVDLKRWYLVGFLEDMIFDPSDLNILKEWREREPKKKKEENKGKDVFLDRKVKIWFEDRKRYYEGRVVEIQGKNQIVKYRNGKTELLTLNLENCHDDAEDPDRWSYIE